MPPVKRSPPLAPPGPKVAGPREPGLKPPASAPPDPARVALVMARLAAERPAPASELDHADPFTLLVAVVLSAQATDAGVNRATPALFAAGPTPAAMVALGEERVRELVRTIGLYRGKARNVVALSAILLAEHGGAVPRDLAALTRLPGVGLKTAKVVLNMGFGEPHIAVDTHVGRVAQRLGFSAGRTADKVSADLEALIPPEWRLNAHHWLLLHGRHCCKARRPECWACPVPDLCPYEPKTPAPKGAAPRATPPASAR